MITKGTFLIASPLLEKGLYFRSVVLICEHNVGGSFGIVINKPLNIEFPDELFRLEEQANLNISILSGGSIQPNQMILLHSGKSSPEQTLQVCEDVFLGGNLEFLQKNIVEANGPYIHLCFGYSAWGPGLLEKEILAGAWFSHPANSEYVFKMPRAKIWTSLLKSMGGKYAAFAMIPEDLSLN